MSRLHNPDIFKYTSVISRFLLGAKCSRTLGPLDPLITTELTIAYGGLFCISRTAMRVVQTGFPAFPIAQTVCSRSRIMRALLIRDLFILVAVKFSNKVVFHLEYHRRKIFRSFSNSHMSWRYSHIFKNKLKI